MDLNIKNKLFIILGATSGFGKSTALTLIQNGAKVIINARGKEKLEQFKDSFPEQIEILPGDITNEQLHSSLFDMIGGRPLDGILVNAGGPAAMSFLDSSIEDWDKAYNVVLRWKVKLTLDLLPKLLDQGYGRLLFVESASVKQPIENLVLSNSLRLAVVGFVKTLSQEIATKGVTANILAPGYHATPAMERLFEKRSLLLGISPDEARKEFEREIKIGKLGDPDDLASLAAWLLSPHSKYITGQTIAVDGGLISNML